MVEVEVVDVSKRRRCSRFRCAYFLVLEWWMLFYINVQIQDDFWFGGSLRD
jgi:hypothetical protein